MPGPYQRLSRAPANAALPPGNLRPGGPPAPVAPGPQSYNGVGGYNWNPGHAVAPGAQTFSNGRLASGRIIPDGAPSSTGQTLAGQQQKRMTNYGGAPSASGYGYYHNNMPIAVVNGNQVYNPGIYATGHGPTAVLDPGKTTLIHAGRAGFDQYGGGGGAGGGNGRAPGYGSGGSFTPGGGGLFGAGGAYGAFQGANAGQTLQDAQNARNAADQQKYNDLLGANDNQRQKLDDSFNNVYGIIGAGQQQASQLAQGLGSADRENIDRGYANLGGQQQSHLIGSGLGNSTVVDSVMRGTEHDRQLTQRGLSDSLAREQIGILEHGTDQNVSAHLGYAGALQQALGDRLGIIGSHQNTLDYQTLLGLLQQPGALGGGFGGYGGYGGGGGGGGGGGTGFTLNRPGGGGGGGGSAYGNVNDSNYLQGYPAQRPPTQNAAGGYGSTPAGTGTGLDENGNTISTRPGTSGFAARQGAAGGGAVSGNDPAQYLHRLFQSYGTSLTPETAQQLLVSQYGMNPDDAFWTVTDLF